MGSYYKRQKQAAAARHVTRAPWLYHATLPDLLPAIREQGLRPLRDVASRLARDAAEKRAADAGIEMDPQFVHLYATEDLLRLELLMQEMALVRVRTAALDPARLTRDPMRLLNLFRSDDPARGFVLGEVIGQLQISNDVVSHVDRRIAARDTAGALEALAPSIASAAERVWDGAPLRGLYRYAGIIPAGSLEVLLELPVELANVYSLERAMVTPLRLDSLRWAPLATAALAAVARGLGRTEFPGDTAL